MAPTAKPTTSKPSVAPSAKPGTPTVRPSLKPSLRPTTRPTKGSDQSVSISINQVLKDVTVAIFNEKFALNSQIFALSLVNSTRSLKASYIKVSSAKTVDLSLVQSISLGLLSKLGLAATVNYAMIPYKISIPSTSAAGFSSGTDALNQTMTQIEIAVSSGKFTTKLNANAAAKGSTSLTVVTAGEFEVTGYSINSAKTTKKLSGGGVAGVVIGVLFFVIIVAAICYHFFVKGKKLISPQAQAGMKIAPSPIVPGGGPY
jgi:hypothetical protein